MFPTIFVKIYP